MPNKKSVLIILLSCVLGSLGLNAQSALLFQIPSSNVQIKAAEASGDKSAIEDFRKYDNQIRFGIYKDFKTNFRAQAVYFFAPDDLDNIKAQKFSAVKFYNHDGELVSLPTGIEDYLIAHVSFFPKVLHNEQTREGEILEEGLENYMGIGIILSDQNFEYLNGPLRFTPCKIFKRGFLKKKRYYDFRGAKALQSKIERFGFPVKSTR